ncbi:anthranilate phosphoribosyltransferase [Fictibacillus aquaticus]|nr:anthranilate phosphoribosyltransferase [Fictibacillus aquaticus]
MISSYLSKIANFEHLTQTEARNLMQEMITSPIDEQQAAALLAALKLRGETPEELAGFVQAVKANQKDVIHSRTGVIDTCGTGGDMKGTFNVSTAASIVLAAYGLPVAKHGNGAVTSASGSMDVLRALNINPANTPEEAKDELEKRHISFLNAPSFHPGLKKFVSTRKKLPFRTVFNLIGPLCNPAEPEFQLLGASTEKAAETIVQAMKLLGRKRALVVSAADGMDELSITSPTRMFLLNEGEIQESVITPEEAGIRTANSLHGLQVSSKEESAELIKKLLKGYAPQPAVDIVALNAGAALYCAQKADTVAEGAEHARAKLASGEVYEFYRTLCAEGGNAHAAY